MIQMKVKCPMCDKITELTEERMVCPNCKPGCNHNKCGCYEFFREGTLIRVSENG